MGKSQEMGMERKPVARPCGLIGQDKDIYSMVIGRPGKAGTGD